MPFRPALIACILSFNAMNAYSQELIANNSFDANIDDWAIKSSSGGTIDWTGSQGQPPGALRMSGAGLTAMPDTCYQLEISGRLTFSFDAFMETGGDSVDCTMNLHFYSGSDDCTGNFAEMAENSTFDIPGTTLPNQWQSFSFELPVPHDPVNQTGVRAIQPVLIKGTGDFGNDDFCVFDNASFDFEPAITAVPTLNEKALTALALLLALGGFAILRRMR